MKLEQGKFCPLIDKDCIGLQCSWFTQIRGNHPQTGEPVDEWGCAVTWVPFLLIENSQQQRETGAAVDTKQITIALFDRVEVKSIGGAAVYGADAVAGVINYILKDDYEGFEFSYDYNSILADFEGGEEAFRGLMGFNSFDGKGNFVLSMEMTKTPRIDETMLPYRQNYLYRTTLTDAAYAGQSGFYESYRLYGCLLYTSPSPRDVEESRMPSSA